MIARCLDNEPANRPSARELVEFMVDLPHGLSREDGSGATDVSTSGTSHLHSPCFQDNAPSTAAHWFLLVKWSESCAVTVQ